MLSIKPGMARKRGDYDNSLFMHSLNYKDFYQRLIPHLFKKTLCCKELNSGIQRLQYL